MSRPRNPDADALLAELHHGDLDPNRDIELVEGWEDADFGSEEEQAPATVADKKADAWLKAKTLTIEQLFQQEDPTWFIDGLIPEGSINVLHGTGGTKKTFLMLDWMLSAAHGLKWQGRTVMPGRVLYIAGEGSGGLKKRIRVWGEAHNIDPTTPNFIVMPEAFNLYKLERKQIPNVALALERAGIDYIVVDTLHRSSAGSSENDSGDISVVYDNAVAIAGGPEGASIWFLHHDSREGKVGGRGSSAIRDDADVSVQIKVSGKLQSLLHADKLKEAEEFEPILLSFGVLGEGNLSSLYISHTGSPDIELVDNWDKKKPGDKKTAEILAMEAIAMNGIDINEGPRPITKKLNDLGYPWTKSTIDRALRTLKTEAAAAAKLREQA